MLEGVFNYVDMIYIIGDTHYHIDIDKLKNVRKFCNEDDDQQNYVIVTGDFGLIWDRVQSDTEEWWIQWYNMMPFTTLFVDGNHENFDRLFSNEFPEIDMFGSKVQKISDKIFHLQRGHIYSIDNKTFFCMGGGESIDKMNRVQGLSWWPQELPTKAELDLGLKNLTLHNNKVDYIITHTCSNGILQELYEMTRICYKPDIEVGLRKYFDYIEETVDFKKWFFGHFHEDIEFYDKYYCLYNNLIKRIS